MGAVAAVAVRHAATCRAATGTIIIAHIMFSLSFVAVTVRARVLDARPVDRGGGARPRAPAPWTTFRLVTLPMIFPAVLAGALLAFALSIDDFVVTSFTAGSTRDVPAVDLGRRQERHAAAGQRHGHADLRGRRADRGRQRGRAPPADTARPGARMHRGDSGSRGRAEGARRRRAARRSGSAEPGAPEPAAAADRPRPPPTWPWSAAGTPGCGRRCSPRSATRAATWSCSRPTGSAGPPPAATAASARPASPTAWPTAWTAGRTRSTALERLGRGEPRRDRGDRCARYGIDCGFERTGELNVATEPWQLDGLAEPAQQAGALGRDYRAARPRRRCGPRSTRRPTSPALWDRDGVRACSTRPGSPGACARPACALGVRIYERTPVRAIARRRRRAARCARRTARSAARRVALGTGALPAAAAPAAALRRAGLRLRADDRAADRRPAGLDRLAQPAGRRRRAATSSTTTG